MSHEWGSEGGKSPATAHHQDGRETQPRNNGENRKRHSKDAREQGRGGGPEGARTAPPRGPGQTRRRRGHRPGAPPQWGGEPRPQRCEAPEEEGGTVGGRGKRHPKPTARRNHTTISTLGGTGRLPRGATTHAPETTTSTRGGPPTRRDVRGDRGRDRRPNAEGTARDGRKKGTTATARNSTYYLEGAPRRRKLRRTAGKKCSERRLVTPPAPSAEPATRRRGNP